MKSIILFAGVAVASGVVVGVVLGDPLTDGVGVSESYDCDLSPVEFDRDPAQMTREQFRAYCVQFNARQIADAKLRHQAYLTERGPMPVTKTTVSSGGSNTRRGGGYGMGGFGGAGGYLGYGNGTGYGGGGFGLGGFGLGGGGVGNNMSSSYTNTTSSTETTLPDLNDTGGGPVTLVNPYCYDYWKQPGHFQLVSQAQRPMPEKPRPSD
jgi:hypothetical protein